LWLGSVKSNIGHTQAAAGAAGVIKMIQAIRHGRVPQTLHVDAPSGNVDWTTGAIRLATETHTWPDTGHPRRAGVSSFGISGTNAHVILEQAPPSGTVGDTPEVDGVVPWVVSARSAQALDGQVERLRSVPATAAPADVGFSLASGRSAFEHRAVLLAGEDGLREVARGTAATRGLAVVFSGQGGQRAGMGRELYARYPVFAEAFDEVNAHLETPCSDGDQAATGWAQPALFAVEVALFRLVSSWGLRPDYLLGHSIGEVTAAHVAGVLSLEDACRLVSARARLMQALPPGGAMVAVRATETEVAPLLTGRVSLAAVNGPGSVVLSGDEQDVRAVAGTLADEGRKVTALRVSHAFHSPLMRPMLAEFRAVVETLSFAPPRLPIISTVTGTPIDDERWCSPEYWVEQVERTVRFADALGWAGAQGISAVLEIGPGGGLAAVAPETLTGDVVPAALLRPERDEQATVLTALAELYVHGVPVDWTALFTDARRVDVPTYAFQRRRFWPRAAPPSGDVTGLGLTAVDHPLVGAGMELPGEAGHVFTARLSLSSCPWLADHVVLGSVLFPGTGFLELAVHLAGRVGCDRVEELTLHAPLVLPEHGGVDVRVMVGPPDDTGRSEIRVFARSGQTWECHASGAVSAVPAARPEVGAVPPAEAVAVDVDGFYARTTEAGFGYGPAFRGLTAVWSADDTVFAEIALPPEEHVSAAGCTLHPALLDAALHAIWFTGSARPRLPFSWGGVSVYAAGATAARVRLQPTGPQTCSLVLLDRQGGLIASVESLTLREVPADGLGRTDPGVGDSLFELRWTPVPDVAATTEDVTILPVRGEGDDVPAAAHEVVGEVLETLRAWLARPDDSPLLISTQRAVDAEAVVDVAASAVWGLVRSAQREHPGRFVLVDTDEPDAVRDVAGAVLASGEPQVVIRDGVLHAARLAPVPAPAERPPGLGDGWVLFSGGGGLARVVVQHVVETWGVRGVVLAGRRGPDAGHVAELTAQGVEVAGVACDVADRGAVRKMFDEFEISAVIHTAGVLDDALLESLTPGQVESVLRPKVDGAWNLHEASADRDLAAFVVFSSAAGVAGSAGQANYAAGNAFQDGLMSYRRSRGLPGVSLAWGAWDQGTGMTAGLRSQDVERMTRAGLPPLTAAQGVALFDAALACDRALVVPMRVDRQALAAQPDEPPPLLRDLLPRRVRPAPAAADDLAGLPPAERPARLLGLVRTEVAAVLGHAGPEAISADRAFTELGFDSLTAVELRNRLSTRTGTRLPAAVVFEHPTSAGLAAYLNSAIEDRTGPATSPDAPDLVTRVYRQALADGRTAEADEFLMSLARLRPTFQGPEDLDGTPAPVRLATGGSRTRLVCLAPVVPLTGDRVYYRLASAFQGNRDVSSITSVGFTAGESLPASSEALVTVLAEAIAEHVGGAPFVLLGHSSGGLLAFDVGKRLAARGVRPTAAVLMDTYAIDDVRLAEFQQEMAESMYRRSDAAPEAIDHASLSAHVWTCALLEGWRPEPAPFPTLLLRASEPLAAGRDDRGWQTSLEHVTTVLDVPGNHFTLADEHIASTAEAIDAWLEEVEEVEEGA